MFFFSLFLQFGQVKTKNILETLGLSHRKQKKQMKLHEKFLSINTARIWTAKKNHVVEQLFCGEIRFSMRLVNLFFLEVNEDNE